MQCCHTLQHTDVSDMANMQNRRDFLKFLELGLKMPLDHEFSQRFASAETPLSQIQVLTLQTQRPCIVCKVLIHPKSIPVVHKGNTKIQEKELGEVLQI